jgi:hypothetical protein
VAKESQAPKKSAFSALFAAMRRSQADDDGAGDEVFRYTWKFTNADGNLIEHDYEFEGESLELLDRLAAVFKMSRRRLLQALADHTLPSQPCHESFGLGRSR